MGSKKAPPRNLRHRLSSLLSKDRTCDVEFLVGDAPQSFLCHRAILASGSAVFEAMFYGDIPQRSPVRLPDVHPRGFYILIQYLYTDSVLLEDDSDAFEAAYVSQKYLVRDLFEACEDYLLQNLELDIEDVLDVLEESSFLQMRRLGERCLRYVSRNAKKILSSKSILAASRDTLSDILRLDVMAIDSESEVIEAVWRWGEEWCRKTGLQISLENVRRVTKDLLKHVRFLALGLNQLVEVLGRCHILDTDHEMALLWNLAMPRKEGVELGVPPDICAISKTRSINNTSKIQFPGQYRYDGSMTSYLIEKQRLEAEITVTGPPVTVIGVVVAFKPIPCYSSSDRSLDVEISADSTCIKSGLKSCLKAEDAGKEEVLRKLLFDNYVVIEEQQAVRVTVTVSGEGVRLMQCAEESLCYDLGKSELSVKFDKGESPSSVLFPIKELMIV